MSVYDGMVRLDFGFRERLLVFRKSFEVPLSSVIDVRVDVPEQTLSLVGSRRCGSNIPGVLRSGSFPTPRGREFWHVPYRKEMGECLILELKGQVHSRLILKPDNLNEWYRKIKVAVLLRSTPCTDAIR